MPVVPSRSESRRGLLAALAAYTLWGILPLYFVLLAGINPFEIVAWRIVLTLVFCAILITAMRQWDEVARVLRDRRLLGRLALAGVVIYINWQTYVVASTSGHVLDASLGYFINPVVTILLAVLLLGERLGLVQWLALGATVVAFGIIAFGYGTFPWVALVLALSFGYYGFVKKDVGGRVSALPGLFVETLVLTPVALGILGVLGATRGLDAFTAEPAELALLACAGIATAIPLLLFAASARRISLTALGFTQYLAPSIMFALGWLVLGEHIPVARWIGFAVVWAALLVLSVETLRGARRSRHSGPDGDAASEPGPGG
ncbi:EamA family transporter RarD [Leucobacter sp. PH1c]|uniref:EamA family transporter RarD n=1 Tax=Leucobacter sp. PH1c TaxID=1397278 RepID=UPI000469D0AE|nr:EamA family transporter RarD [Leucobacter sp. PH1c]